MDVKHRMLHGIGRVANKFRGDISVLKRKDISWILSKKNFIDRSLINGYYFEPDRLEKCVRYIEDLGITSFLDVGANFGLYSLHFAKNTNLREILAFEPVTQNYNQLCANIFLNRFDKLIQAHRLALSDEDRAQTIYVDSLSTGISKFREWQPLSSSKTRNREYYNELIESKRLDNLLGWRERKILVKIDVEGHEAQVLAGMKQTLANNKVVLQIEVQPENQRDVKAFLGELCYKEIGRIGWDWYFSNIGQ